MATAANAIRTTDVSGDRRRPAHARLTVNLLVATCAALVACLTWTAGAWAAAPANDAFDAAAPIAALPFSESVDMSEATIESGEPQYCSFSDRSVWYQITATQSGTLAADAASSSAYAQMSVYRADGSGVGGLSFVGCENFGSQPVVFAVAAGETYYLQASTIYGSSGTLQVQVESKPPPANDDFGNATAVGSVPFSQSIDLIAATTQSGEPTTCQGLGAQETAWYAFTPSQSGSYVAGRSGYGVVAAYSGSSLSSLTQLSCGTFQTVFRAEAGTTYYLQVAGRSWWSGPEQFSLTTAPEARASFYYWPSDPSILDEVSFYDYSSDIAGIGSRSWNLGDGFTSTDYAVSHRYAADGSYAATLGIVTTDGRTASTSQTVPVRTHDVAITAMSVPSKAQVGRTKQLAVKVNNSRYAETVQVSILRSVPGQGFVQVGQVTQGVPARSARRSTTFDISYTFDEQDAELGKVTFQAVATILTARDANPADNTVIAPVTKVTA